MTLLPQRYETLAIDLMRAWLQYGRKVDPMAFGCELAVLAVHYEERVRARRVPLRMIWRTLRGDLRARFA